MCSCSGFGIESEEFCASLMATLTSSLAKVRLLWVSEKRDIFKTTADKIVTIARETTSSIRVKPSLKFLFFVFFCIFNLTQD